MNTGKLILSLALAAAAGLAGCNNPDNARSAGSHICTPFAEPANANASVNAAPGAVPPAQPAADPAAAVDDCLHRWGYTLATTSDRAPDVAQAVVAACMPALTRWNQQALANAANEPSQNNLAAPSLLTGQVTTPMAEHYSYAQGRALFYVVQARAGKCAPPPAATNNR